jgi:hypothetical protein
MKPSLAVLRSRVDAAAVDFLAFKAQMQTTINAHGDPIRLRLTADREPNVILASAGDAMSIPDAWPRAVAHITYDLRSVLDQLMTQLYIASNGRRPPKRIGKKWGPGAKLQFPICTTRENFAGEIKKGRIEGLDDRFGHLVWHFQPFRVKGKKRIHALALLEALSNTDKHNHPNITGFAFDQIRVRVHSLRESCVVTGVDIAPGAAKLLKKRSHLARIHVRRTGVEKPGVGVYLEGTGHPAFDNGLWVEQVIGAIFNDVRGILGDAERLIAGDAPGHLVGSAKIKTRGKAVPPWPPP